MNHYPYLYSRLQIEITKYSKRTLDIHLFI